MRQGECRRCCQCSRQRERKQETKITERDRNRQLKDGLATQGYLPTLLVDWSIGSENPYDMIVACPGGVYWAIESKQVQIPAWRSKQTLLGPRSFRSHQLSRLLKVVEQGGRASVILFVQPPRPIETRVWALSAYAVAEMVRQDRVLRLTDLGNTAADAYELIRLPQGRWGLGEHMLTHHMSHGFPV